MQQGGGELLSRIRRWRRMPGGDAGASAVEYGLLIGGVAAAIALTVYLFGDAVLALFTSACDVIYATTC